MKLIFRVEVEANQYGEKNVPYLKHALNVRGGWVGHTQVIYEGNTAKHDRLCEVIEQDAYERGEIDL